jgi:hypothetical protein
MTKAQFWLLNLAGGACAALIVGVLILNRSNDGIVRQLDATQARLTRAQSVQGTAQNLIVRIAQAARTEPALRELLTRHDLKVELPETSSNAKP